MTQLIVDVRIHDDRESKREVFSAILYVDNYNADVNDIPLIVQMVKNRGYVLDKSGGYTEGYYLSLLISEIAAELSKNGRVRHGVLRNGRPYFVYDYGTVPVKVHRYTFERMTRGDFYCTHVFDDHTLLDKVPLDAAVEMRQKAARRRAVKSSHVLWVRRRGQ